MEFFWHSEIIGTGKPVVVVKHQPAHEAKLRPLVQMAFESSGLNGKFSVKFETDHSHKGPPKCTLLGPDLRKEISEEELTQLNKFSVAVVTLFRSRDPIEPNSPKFLQGQVFLRSAQFALLLIPKRNREHLIGDLEEEYRTLVLPQYGQFWAGLWYWAQTSWAIGPYLWMGVKRLLGLATILKLIGK